MWREDKDRGTGRTLRQLVACPKGSLFVWCNDDMLYIKPLCAFIGRTDIHVLRRSDLSVRGQHWWLGREYPAIIVDHALEGLSSDELDALVAFRSRVR